MIGSIPENNLLYLVFIEFNEGVCDTGIFISVFKVNYIATSRIFSLHEYLTDSFLILAALHLYISSNGGDEFKKSSLDLAEVFCKNSFGINSKLDFHTLKIVYNNIRQIILFSIGAHWELPYRKY